MRVSVLVVVLVGSAVASASLAGAATLEVGPGHAYATIEAAILDANTGDVVVVSPGTYHERINFIGKWITVRSTSPTTPSVVATTVIDGGKQGSVVKFENDERPASVLTGFTITNGSGTLFTGVATGVCGGGVFCVEASPTITGNIIRGNSATDYGGGVYCWHCSPTLSNNTISGNASATGGGMYCQYLGPALTNNTISGNSATANGGGLYCDASNPTLTGNIVSGNKVLYDHGGGAGIFCSQSSPALTNNLISGNLATGAGSRGGGLHCYAGSSPTLTNNTIAGNSATYGGGVLCYLSSSPVFTNTIIALNLSGGGLYQDVDVSHPCSPGLAYCDVYGNTGGNYVNFIDPTGGGGNIAKDPLFANAASGNYRLKSQVGRYNDATKTWVVDTVTSPCIDAGDPASAYPFEPPPSGGRVNMGYDGNTTTASKTKSAPGVVSDYPQGTDASAQSPTIGIDFDQAMNKTVTQGAFSLTIDGATTRVPGTFTWVTNYMQYKVTGALAPLTTYRATASAAAKSAAGVAMGWRFTWTFKTTAAPAVSAYQPQSSAALRSSKVTITFNEAMNQKATQGAFSLKKAGTGTALLGTFAWSGNQMQFKPSATLAAGSSYQVTLTTAAKSSGGVALAATFTWTFKTGATSPPRPDVVAAAAPTAQGAEIVVSLASAADVTVTIRNLAGRPVAALTPGALDEGTHTLVWNGQSALGTKAPAGTYLVEVTARSSDGSSRSVLTALRR